MKPGSDAIGCPRQRIDWAALAMTGMSAHALLRFLVIAAFLVRLSSGPMGLNGCLWLGLKPGLLALAAVTSLILWRRRRDRPTWQSAAILSAFLVVLGAYFVGPFGGVHWDSLSLGMVVALATALSVGGWACRQGRPLPGSVLFALTLASAAAVHGVIMPDILTQVNSLGLVSSKMNEEETRDYAGELNKDHYPLCTFRNNSLGYRDDEPPASSRDGRRRILIVGDSFVWGDGIPTNGETIGRLLGAELERAAPGRYVVMSAAHAGLGLYGYGRIIDTVAPLYRPEVVVVGYLGRADWDPLDPQFLVDRLPANFLARNLVLGLRVAQYVHESSVVWSRFVWHSQENESYFNGLQRSFARRAAERGYRLLFLSYFDEPTLSRPPTQTLALSADLRYPGHANALWYGKDAHPKPALNLILARQLAAAILRLRPVSKP